MKGANSNDWIEYIRQCAKTYHAKQKNKKRNRKQKNKTDPIEEELKTRKAENAAIRQREVYTALNEARRQASMRKRGEASWEPRGKGKGKAKGKWLSQESDVYYDCESGSEADSSDYESCCSDVGRLHMWWQEARAYKQF